MWRKIRKKNVFLYLYCKEMLMNHYCLLFSCRIEAVVDDMACSKRIEKIVILTTNFSTSNLDGVETFIYNYLNNKLHLYLQWWIQKFWVVTDWRQCKFGTLKSWYITIKFNLNTHHHYYLQILIFKKLFHYLLHFQFIQKTK